MRTVVSLCALLGLAGLPALLYGKPGHEAEAERIAALVRQLGDEDFARREAASRELARVGEPALAALRQATAVSDDPEVRLRAGLLAEAIEADQPFFNGKDLSGWRGLPGCWAVKDGALVGNSDPAGLDHNTFLCSRRVFRDFELKFRVRVVGVGWAGNSGVQVRSQLIDADRCVVKGPQCDIGEGYWGDLYGELSGGLMKQAPLAQVARVVKEGEFNDYVIRCAGQHVTIRVNGVTTVDDDFDGLHESGVIAWQLHGGGPMTVTFKDIEFKELPPPQQGPNPPAPLPPPLPLPPR
jgi:hypothetical protein